MKTMLAQTLTVACFTMLTAASPRVARADDSSPAVLGTQEKTFTGTILAVDSKERVLKGKRFLFPKSFYLGDHCVVVVGDKKDAGLGSLRPGQKVEVSYRDVSGVLVASRVEQRPMIWSGRVARFDAPKRSLIVRDGNQMRTFLLSPDCKILMAGNSDGKPDALQPGHKVRVTYETPAEGLLARRVELSSRTFTGKITSIDIESRTVKAEHVVGSMTFRIAQDCQILVNGKSYAELNNLGLGRRFTFSFEKVDGVNVVNRIASAAEPASASTTAAVH